MRKQKQFTIAISPGSYVRLKRIAISDGKGSASLAAAWVQDRIDEEYRWRIDAGLLAPGQEDCESEPDAEILSKSLALIRAVVNGEGVNFQAADLAIAAQALGIPTDKLVGFVKNRGLTNAGC